MDLLQLEAGLSGSPDLDLQVVNSYSKK